MNYTDLHCDTAYEIYKTKSRLDKNGLHIDFEKAGIFEKYSQIFAIWSDNDKSDDENYEDFFKIRDYFLESFSENKNQNKISAYLAVEGGKLLSDDLSRLDILYNCGVRFLTLVWNGVCKIGGAFNTNEGLTDFGKQAVKKCEELGIIIDISHGSDKLISDVFDISGKPVIASHSSSRKIISDICPGQKTLAKRNLSDGQFLEIKKRGGVVGISLCRGHIANEEGPVNISDIIKHIDYYLSLGGEDIICFGCDFDGAPMPDDIGDITGVMKICEELKKRGFSDSLIENIMYRNADNFIERNIKDGRV
ncbi:MAG: membrane dipeptidase [Oscillospiraceae bacterium]|nr:membrane dipeptidase [Oscillospiraceae bacterium]